MAWTKAAREKSAAKRRSNAGWKRPDKTILSVRMALSNNRDNLVHLRRSYSTGKISKSEYSLQRGVYLGNIARVRSHLKSLYAARGA